MWRQFESVAVVSASFAEERSVDGQEDGREATGLRPSDQLNSDAAVLVDVQLEEAKTGPHPGRYLFDARGSDGAEGEANTDTVRSCTISAHTITKDNPLESTHD